jgi:hypothetical protein
VRASADADCIHASRFQYTIECILDDRPTEAILIFPSIISKFSILCRG